MNELENFLESTKLTAGKTKNIADFDFILLDELSEIKQETVGEGDKAFKQFVAIFREEKLRIPVPVLIDLKKILVEYALNKIQVIKSGSGLETKYTLVPLDAIKRIE